MHEQVLTLRPVNGREIAIATAHGIIEIRRVEDEPKKLRITLPEGLFAQVGRERVEQRNGWLVVKGESVSPKKKLYKSVVDEDGMLVRLAPQHAVRAVFSGAKR